MLSIIGKDVRILPYESSCAQRNGEEGRKSNTIAGKRSSCEGIATMIGAAERGKTAVPEARGGGENISMVFLT